MNARRSEINSIPIPLWKMVPCILVASGSFWTNPCNFLGVIKAQKRRVPPYSRIFMAERKSIRASLQSLANRQEVNPCLDTPNSSQENIWDILKTPSKEEKVQGRLQFVLNMDSPGPAAYSPPTMGFRETIAPSYTFGRKTPPRGIGEGRMQGPRSGALTWNHCSVQRAEGGGRRAWQKSWFMSKNPFWRKVDFNTETNWPSPSQYGQLLGTKLGNQPTTPNFTFGQRGEYCLINKSTIDEPGPNQYNVDRAYTLVLHRSPSIIINPAPLTLYKWIGKETTPGPGAYNVDTGYNARLPKCPGFYIQGVRRPKKHETGPFSTL